MWPFPKYIPEPIVKKLDVETYCDQMANHVREVLRNKLLMDDATKRACEINRTTTYECKDYAHAIKNNNKARDDFNNRRIIWAHHNSMLGILILPNTSIIVNVDGIKYKVTNKKITSAVSYPPTIETEYYIIIDEITE